ncbi:hypothetical protein [Thermoflexus sp.]|uniref:hypothetical protein n=1 Tax=Thermoflexus sp. TaxID=1969742 RepID=UPI0035E45C2F
MNNEFSDWDTALHTFSFASAVHQAMHRFPSRALLRGVFDVAMGVYLDHFLNIPLAPLPEEGSAVGDPDHTIQMMEAAFRQFPTWRGTPLGDWALIAAARYLAAHVPTHRAQEQTYRTAERLYEELIG